ncbi:hypothetical protein [Nocardia vaccinii]|uniref:hypothetical protein n=1 Tax=Nocardia vaccinii TaxID=1822 RepID=UPI00082E9EA1|nr:hypothetical protein [Nocardia vaccinii]
MTGLISRDVEYSPDNTGMIGILLIHDTFGLAELHESRSASSAAPEAIGYNARSASESSAPPL